MQPAINDCVNEICFQSGEIAASLPLERSGLSAARRSIPLVEAVDPLVEAVDPLVEDGVYGRRRPKEATTDRNGPRREK
ncbi:hypothetical protein U4E84_14275 [Halorubrum sp. AD140]|uniref:hypothetical protein n=1 Tax=Halorubrum sp. AD140 TaxID=3050073 RepID=UPI002ACCE8F2|nr:hypothetical protein [Halorubrum sp. AD140]MDZ5812512.1 hypothetical protein [Halorubrum sp. AD140]